jgi:hypothetical protein
VARSRATAGGAIVEVVFQASSFLGIPTHGRAVYALVHDGENGLLFHARDRAQAGAALVTLFDDTARRRDLATGAASTGGQYEESAMFARLVDNLQEAVHPIS